MIVLDASAALELLLGTETGARVHARLAAADGELLAPHLLDVEVAQVLRRYVREGGLDEPRARAALEDLADLPVRRQAHHPLLPLVWALRENATAYDAVYLALADVHDAALLTCDAKLAAVPGVGRRVEVIS